MIQNKPSEQCADNYHEHPAASRTGLKCFRQSRRLYHARHVLRLPEAQLTPTRQMNLGTLTHAELLEPGSLEGHYAVLTDWPDFRTNAAKEWRAAQEQAGKMVVKREDIASMVGMVKAVAAVAGTWLKHGRAIIEKPIFWTDHATGMQCRCKPDWLIDLPGEVLAFDFKSTDDASPSAFARQVSNMELWMQDEHYTRGIREEFAKPVTFTFVAASPNYPFHVSVHQIDRNQITQPKISGEYCDTLMALARCMETGDWSEPWERTINKVALFDWSFRSDAMGQ